MRTMRADRIEQDSQTWLAIHEWATERLDSLRKRNDGALDGVATAHLRGQIATLKQILALPDKVAPTEPGDE